MRVAAVELSRLELTLDVPMLTSAGTHARRPLLLVRVETDEGVGYGECSALLEPHYTEEYADGAELVLAEHLLPRLAERASFEDAAAAMAHLAVVRGHRMAKAAIEMALLDAELRAGGISLAEHLGASTATVLAGANLGIGEPEVVLDAVAAVAALGYRRVKCKIAPGHDVEIVVAVRDAFPDLVVSVDANGAYDLGNAEHLTALEQLDGLGLAAIEQPLGPDDLLGHARLAALLETPIVLDESIPSAAVLEVALELGACDGVSVKTARLGGIEIARRVHDRCVEVGVHLSIGGMLESGVGRAAALAVAAMPGFDLPGDLGASDRYFATDLTRPHELDEGRLAVPSGPGLGVVPDEDVVGTLRVRSRTFISS